MRTIVFSRDRAMQLDAFLRSYQDHVQPLGHVHVLFTTTSLRHARAYQQMFEAYPWAVPCRQSESFQSDVVGLIHEATHVIFFVDDQLFVRPWEAREQAGLSLRLGLNLTFDYNSALERQPVPAVTLMDDDLVSWRWAEGVGAWGYPLSLDGHIFDAQELRWMVSNISFGSPNTFEAALQTYRSLYAERRGACYLVSKVVNVPWNQVQRHWSNRHMEGNDAEALLQCWERGQRISLRHLYGVLNESTHQEFPLVLEQAA